MHLVISTPHFPPESGGPGTYAKILADNFPGLGVTVDVVRFAEVRPYPKVLRPLLYFILVFRAARKADVILTLDPVSTGFPAALAALLLRKPLVAKIVGDCAWERGRQQFGVTASLDEFVRMRNVPFAVRAYRAAQEWVAGRANRIIVPSNYLKGIVAAWGVPETKIEVVYNSVELGEPGIVPDAVAELEGFTIVTVARLVRWKHVDEIISAVKAIPGANLVVVGDGPERQALEDVAQGDPRIVFVGAIPNDQALAIIKRSDALVLNSSYEGMSHVLIEGLMAGVPIVATRAGGNAEVLADDSGLLIPCGDSDALKDAITQLKEDPNLRDRLRRAATKRAEAFSVATMLERTKAILTSVQSRG